MTAVDARAHRADIVVVTGLSGAGKSTAIKVFEDLGYYCVDNLPPILLPKIVDVVSEARGEGARVALGMDIRGKEFLPDLSRVLDELRRGRSAVHVLFLDAADEALVRRFSAATLPALTGSPKPLIASRTCCLGSIEAPNMSS